MKPLLIDLKHAMARIEQTSYSHGITLNKDGIRLTLVSPSISAENYGFEPAQSVELYGAENIRSLGVAMLAFCEGHYNEFEEQQKNKP